jgi:quercetin dioxygenase-like cupin family protein
MAKSDLIAKALELSGLVNYQKDAVVSKTLIDKTVGTVTAFAFDKSQGLSEHTAPYDAMVYIMDGSARITISRKPQTVNRGQFIILPANKPHALHAIERFKMLLIMIRK